LLFKNIWAKTEVMPLRHLAPNSANKPVVSPAQVVIQELAGGLLIALGILCAGMGIKGFLLSSGFIDGGVTGMSMLLAQLLHWPLALLLPVVNLPFVILAYRQLGWAFALRSALAIGGLAVAITVIPYPDVTHDPMLTALFGGLFLGAGIGLAVRGHGVLDGTEIAALLISKRSQVVRVGDVILVFNVVLFLASMTLLGVNQALYSIVTYFAATKTLDFILYGLDEFTAVTVISERHDQLRTSITRDLGRGVTAYRGYGGMSGEDKHILFCVVTRLELGRLRTMVRNIDPAAFVVFHPLSGAEGGVVRSPKVR
jgi:uncharacterized membrane-anchored protein YitT (DUF2179 family)